MGLLASGAAHELGTPLAQLAVVLGDWRHMPQIKADGALVEEVAEMEAAVTYSVEFTGKGALTKAAVA